jgi:hypothetical protein
MSEHCEIFKYHINIIRQLKQLLVKYDIMIQDLIEQNNNKPHSNYLIEIDFFKNIQIDLNKQIGEHEGLCFIISKLSIIDGNNINKNALFNNT